MKDNHPHAALVRENFFFFGGGGGASANSGRSYLNPARSPQTRLSGLTGHKATCEDSRFKVQGVRARGGGLLEQGSAMQESDLSSREQECNSRYAV